MKSNFIVHLCIVIRLGKKHINKKIYFQLFIKLKVILSGVIKSTTKTKKTKGNALCYSDNH